MINSMLKQRHCKHKNGEDIEERFLPTMGIRKVGVQRLLEFWKMENGGERIILDKENRKGKNIKRGNEIEYKWNNK